MNSNPVDESIFSVTLWRHDEQCIFLNNFRFITVVFLVGMKEKKATRYVLKTNSFGIHFQSS